MIDKKRRFGIEFEFSVEQKELDRVAPRIIASIYGKNSYVSKDEKYSVTDNFSKWHIKRENDLLGEINTPVSKIKDLSKIAKVIGHLAKKKVPVNEECGLHVHIEVPDINKYCLIAYWMQSERAILECFPLQRRRGVTIERMVQRADQNKFVSEILLNKTTRSSHSDIISLRDYEDRKTVEFRVAEGTTDTNLVINWAKFLLYWVERLKKEEPILLACKKCNCFTLEELLKVIEVDESTRDFMLWRSRKYQKLSYWVN